MFLGIFIAAPPNIFGTEVKRQHLKERFSQEDLNQMFAPIALYPDSLLDQMLMAATYPLEVVAADSWVKEKPNLKGGALNTAFQLTRSIFRVPFHTQHPSPPA